MATLGAPVATEAAEHSNPLAQFQQREGTLFDTGWELARANSAFCTSTAPSIGLMVHDWKPGEADWWVRFSTATR
ncbi:MAG: hypothetical protein ACM308_00090 [Qipengyuania vulgaris]